MDGKISDESPFGKAMLGKKVGDVVEVEAPIGIVKYEILKIDKLPLSQVKSEVTISGNTKTI